MCGIIGYIGDRKAVEILVDGLRRLEYRGYDSCGIAVVDKPKLYLKRVNGRVEVLNQIVSKESSNGMAGIAHTRWATHGVPSEDNAHPHTDCGENLVIVHNGIIENYLDIKEKLIRNRHRFKSETDTEVIVHLLEEKIKELHVSEKTVRTDLLEPIFFEAFRKTVQDLRGSFAVSVIWSKCPDMILGARMHSPLVVGLGKNENFLASDVSAFLKFSRKVIFMNDFEIVALKKNTANFFNFSGKKIEKNSIHVQWDDTMAEKGGYKHYMLKEIHEQSQSVENTIRGRLLPLGMETLKKELGLTSEFVKSIRHVQIVACGTAYHAGMIARYVFENFSIPTSVDLASEFTDRSKIIKSDTLLIAISQSGETADTLYAVRDAKKSGAKVLAITNTVGSSLTRESHFVLQTYCGPEIGVASTKAFLGQLAAVYILAIHLSVAKKTIFEMDAKKYIDEIMRIPSLINETLDREKDIEKTALKFSQNEHFLFISRHVNYPVALEGALKIKEISYVHAEGYAAGEMKHGPIAIIEKGMPVVAIATSSRFLELIRGNIEEAKARGAEIIAIVDSDSKHLVKAQNLIEVPKTMEIFSPILNTIPLQLFAYYVALSKKCDIDKPRNLAKSVTVR